jgi:hypothetical protein
MLELRCAFALARWKAFELAEMNTTGSQCWRVSCKVDFAMLPIYGSVSHSSLPLMLDDSSTH